MRLSSRVLALVFVAVAIALTACFGGGDSGNEAPDLSKVPTATLPAELPPARSLGQSVVSTGGRRTYTIQAGDTFSAIAEQFGITLEDLIAANPDVDPTSLVSGDVIKLPGAVDAVPPVPAEPAAEPTVAPAEEQPTEIPVEEVPPTDTPAPPPPEDTPTPSSLGTTYIVQAGDTFATIAVRFGVTIESLAAANPGVDSSSMQVGQVLMLPPAGG
jgi:LysM repeat protein